MEHINIIVEGIALNDKMEVATAIQEFLADKYQLPVGEPMMVSETNLTEVRKHNKGVIIAVKL